MTAVNTNHIPARNMNSGMIAKLVQSVSAWNDARVTRQALSRLTDRELADIGLTRFDIERVAR